MDLLHDLMKCNETELDDYLKKSLEEMKKEYLEKGILEYDKSTEEENKDTNKLIVQCNHIEKFQEIILKNILKMKDNIQIDCSVKYNIVHSIKIKRRKNKEYQYSYGRYKVKRKNTSYFMNHFLFYKTLWKTPYSTIHKCFNVVDNKMYCIKMYYLNICQNFRYPYRLDENVYLENQIHKMLNEILVLTYLNHSSIVPLKKIFLDQEKEIMYLVFPYISYKSMNFSQKHKLYRVGKKIEQDDDTINIKLYSESFIRALFKHFHNTFSYMVKKRVVYLDFKPDHVIFQTNPTEHLQTFTIKKEYRRKRKIPEQPEDPKGSDSNANGNPSKKACTSESTKNSKTFAYDFFTGWSKKWKGGIWNFKEMNLKIMMQHDIRRLYNVDPSVCFLYDENVKKIFFRKADLDDVFLFKKNNNQYLQIFVEKTNVKEKETEHLVQKSTEDNLILEKEKKPKKKIKKRRKYDILDYRHSISYEKRLKNMIGNPNGANQINEIKDVSFFKCNELKFLNFLKFYLIYFYQTKHAGDICVYVNLYFLKKYYHASIKKNDQEYKDEPKVKIKKKNHSKKCPSNEIVKYKLIDFDTHAFKTTSIITFCNGTTMFNSNECLFHFKYSIIHLLKKLSYNFGCVLYVFLFGKLPYGCDVYEMIRRFKEKLRFPKYRPISKDLKQLLRKLLTMNLKRRMKFKDIINHKWFSDEH